MNNIPESPRADDSADNLEEPLRGVVERICNRPVCADSLQRALERANQVSGGVARPRHRLFVASLKVAAAVLVAFTLWWLWPTEGWTRVAEAVRTRPWIHGISRQPDGSTAELWLSASRDVSASRHGDQATYLDHRLNVRYSYDPSEKTLYRMQEGSLAARQLFDAFRDAFGSILRKQEKVSSPFAGCTMVQQERRKVITDGRTWIEYDLTVRDSVTEELVRLVFRITSGQALPSSMRITLLRQPKRTFEFALDYPEEGPRDVYSLGVPRATRLVDRVPPEDLAGVLKGVRVGRERFGPYHAIVVETGQIVPNASPWRSPFAWLVWRKGNRWRVEHAQAIDATENPSPPAPEMNPLEWWKKRLEKFEFHPHLVCNGKAIFEAELSARPGRKEPPTWKERNRIRPDQDGAEGVVDAARCMPEKFAYPLRGFPYESQEMELDRSSKEGPPDSVLVTVRATRFLGEHAYHRCRYWIDPHHSYVTLRFVYDDLRGPDGKTLEGDEGSVTYEMERLEQTPTGVWYPTVARWKNWLRAIPGEREARDKITRFYLDFKTDLPDSLFEPQERRKAME